MAANTYHQKPKGIQFKETKKKKILEIENEEVSWLLEKCKEKKTAAELIAEIVAEIEAPPVYYKKLNEIYDSLSQIIKFFYRNQSVKIELFGSSLTKLALKDSDVDIFLDFGGNLPEPPEKLVRSLKNKVRKYGYFINAIPIFARVPIVHCIHRNRVSCDLSFLNAIGVSNSHLIRFLMSLDERMRPLILILKFLMKTQGLLGKNALTSYALIVLVIFFLQKLENPLIPAIKVLQNLADKKLIVAEWDTSFTTEISLLPLVNNQLSVTDLLQKFFEFYSTFEFGFYIISTFTGKSYLKPVFSDQNAVPEEFILYKKNLTKNPSNKFDYQKFMCVQGPFNHCNNITRNVTQKSVLKFQHLCSINAAVGRELLDKNATEENKIKYLIKLFNQKSEEPKSKKLKMEVVNIFVGENIIFDNFNCTEDDLRNEWSKWIFNSVKDILSKVMKCELNVQSKAHENDLPCSENEQTLIKCELKHFELITKLRNEVKNEFDFPQNMSAIGKEEIISNYLCDTVLKNTVKISLKFEITCSIRKGPTCFCMNLNFIEAHKCNHLNQQVFHFIQNNFPKWIK